MGIKSLIIKSDHVHTYIITEDISIITEIDPKTKELILKSNLIVKETKTGIQE